MRRGARAGGVRRVGGGRGGRGGKGGARLVGGEKVGLGREGDALLGHAVLAPKVAPLLRAAGAETVVLGSLAFGAPDLAARMAWLAAL